MPGDLIRREALERIIQRAAELQAGERDIGEGLTEKELLALGQDVGIPPRYLRQALLEERTRSVAPEARGFLSWLAGPATLAAERVVPGDRSGVERALTAWMESEESLQVKRRYADHTTWEPRIGAFASIQRALGAGGKSFALARATEVAAQVTPLEAGFCHVRLTASVRGQRAQRLWGTAALIAFGVALAGVVPILGALAPWSLVPPVVVWAVAVGVARRHRHENERVHVGLEQVLDRLERGEIRSDRQIAGPRMNAFVRIADEIRKTFEII
ncbi:MAG: hypothetical protein E6K55_14300 [Gemmatimonadetes bacterium]|nr:MAG: hypothetical protein DMD67_16150 [Gemmatimonadota bacterium]PYO98613.1 MAG: hypothetical protein DMD61_09420 [Gemmatimonadota bacterium]TLY48137.1 MAG: hypothetical protein E6K55_14300 [Gemmatimonadota bacterium]